MKYSCEVLRSMSFRGYLLTLLVLLSMMFSLLGAVAIGTMSRHELEQSIGANLEDVAFQMADKLDRGMFERLREIMLMARKSELRDATIFMEKKKAILEDAKSTLPVHAWISLTDPNGTVLAATDGLLEGNNVSARPWFLPSQKGPYIGDVHGALLLAQHLPAPPDGNLRFVDVAAPVHAADGSLLGVLCSHLTWEWAREVEASLFRDLKTDRNVDIFVYSESGEPLLVPEGTHPRQWPNLNALYPDHPHAVSHVVLNWPDGEYLTGLAPENGHRDYSGLGWMVLARQKTSIAYAPARVLLFRALMFGCVLGVFAVAVGVVASRRLTKPLMHIAEAAEAIRGGNLHIRIPIPKHPAELATLSSSLSTLVAELLSKNQALTVARDTLEEKVQERTAELSESQALLTQAQSIGKIGGWQQKLDSLSTCWTAETFRLLGIPETTPPDSKSLATVFDPFDQQIFNEVMLKAGDTGEPFDLNLRLAPTKVGRRWVRVIGKRDDRKDVRILSGTIQDITDEMLLKELREDMDRVARHDLKSPLSGIIGLPQLMMDDANLNDEQRETLQLIQDSGCKILSMINISLDLFRMEQGTYEMSAEPVDLIHIIKMVFFDLDYAIRSKNLDVLITAGGMRINKLDKFMCIGEELLLYSVFSNLIKNALESSPEGETVSVKMLANDVCTIAIHNSGEVPTVFRGNFFEKYATFGKVGGTGLGTYSAWLMVKTMEGDIELDTTEAGATTLTVKLLCAQ